MQQALALIAEAKRTRATRLDLGNCGLTELPDELFELTWLEELILSDERWEYEDEKQKWEIFTSKNSRNSNNIQLLKSAFGNLRALEKLYLNGQKELFDLSHLQGLSNLKLLSVDSTQVRDLSPLQGLSNLQRLDADSTQVSDLSPLQGLSNLQKLWLQNLQVSDLSPLKDMSNLQQLHVSSTQVSDLSPLQGLSNLHGLYVQNTQVSDLSPLKDFSNLQVLNVRNTQVSDLSPLKDLSNLQKLNVRNTQVSDLSPLKDFIIKGLSVKWDTWDGGNGIHVKDCPLENPPIEIINQGDKAIRRYFEEQERVGTITLNEARLLIVGQAGAGKTSLRTKLMNSEAELPAEDKTTRGIAIENYQFPTEVGPFDLRIWDFGGQNIQHYAHQFFLSDSVVYALVRDERKEDGGMNYWLNIISLLGKDSPVIIVQNLREGHGEDIKELAAIRKAFPKVQDPIKINLKRAAEEGYLPYRDLKEAICSHAKRLPHVGRSYAATYKLLQDDLQVAAKDKHFIRLEDYESICQERGMTNRDTMYDFLRSYHQLGVSLWFEHDVDLENYIFLKPKWLIDALFELLYENNERRQEAIIDARSVKNIWCGDEYRGMHGILLKLMRNFEMCYEMSDGERYLIPQNQPPCDIELTQSETATRVLFEYEFLPKGFLTRLICRQHHRIMGDNVWNNAVIFGEENGSTVLAYETYEQNVIELIAEGSGKAQLLNETISQLDAIHKDSKFKNLQVKKLVPCPCRECKTKDKPYYFNYDYLRGKILRGSKKVECQNLFDDVLIRDILKEIQIFPTAQIEDLLANDRIDEALRLLRGLLDDDHAVILMMGQLVTANRDFLLEKMTREDYNVIKAKKVLYILEHLIHG